MAWSPHWNPVSSKEDWAEDVNELIAELSGDPSERLKHPARMAKADIEMLARVLDTIKRRLAKAEPRP